MEKVKDRKAFVNNVNINFLHKKGPTCQKTG